MRCFLSYIRCDEIVEEKTSNLYTCSTAGPFSTLSAFKTFGIGLAPVLGFVKIVIIQQFCAIFLSHTKLFYFIPMTFSRTMFAPHN